MILPTLVLICYSQCKLLVPFPFSHAHDHEFYACFLLLDKTEINTARFTAMVQLALPEKRTFGRIPSASALAAFGDHTTQ